MRTSRFRSGLLLRVALAVALLGSAQGRAAILEIEGLVVFGAPVFAGGAVEVPLVLTQPIDSAFSGSIVLTSTPHPSQVLIPNQYLGAISVAILGRPELISLDFVDPTDLLPGVLLTWRFSPIPEGATLALDTAHGTSLVTYLETFNLNDASGDTFPLSATTTIPSAPVPEPGSMLFMLAGLGVLTVLRVRREAAER